MGKSVQARRQSQSSRTREHISAFPDQVFPAATRRVLSPQPVWRPPANTSLPVPFRIGTNVPCLPRRNMRCPVRCGFARPRWSPSSYHKWNKMHYELVWKIPPNSLLDAFSSSRFYRTRNARLYEWACGHTRRPCPQTTALIDYDYPQYRKRSFWVVPPIAYAHGLYIPLLLLSSLPFIHIIFSIFLLLLFFSPHKIPVFYTLVQMLYCSESHTSR